MMLEWLGLGVIAFTQSVAPAGPENIGKKYMSHSKVEYSKNQKSRT